MEWTRGVNRTFVRHYTFSILGLGRISVWRVSCKTLFAHIVLIESRVVGPHEPAPPSTQKPPVFYSFRQQSGFFGIKKRKSYPGWILRFQLSVTQSWCAQAISNEAHLIDKALSAVLLLDQCNRLRQASVTYISPLRSASDVAQTTS